MNVTIRPLASLQDYHACVELQEETWGRGFSERVSPAILKVSQILGGVAAGAFTDEGDLVGFVFGMTGVREGRIVHWSDMLAVRADLRDSGLGRRLKLYQRTYLLERGVTTMYWTFDPLQSRNAYLNFTRLGIVVREYVRDMYGDTDSPLHRGIGTDRFIALWLMDGERARARVAGERPVDRDVLEGAHVALGGETGPDGLPLPGPAVTECTAARVRVAIPADIAAVMRRDMDVAVLWRERTRTVLVHFLERGYEVRELVRDGPLSHYLLVNDR